ncbi:glutamine synthetase family protein [Acidiphilium sp. AL]|uniref:Glutamine synthetase family protein n=1 Tax=Acidiphilium iwatense TaxID=768198 RepID=A0ABS9DWN1_9PROT|nr:MULTISPECIES: glutamine synthetase family protein [Acidiphilium]MCF3946595.1 glutamine synthetase family protein [Acidiphilium iwatense]MCU4160224.1 glutamine synthetase family protein [Acidiphilium sp. AL]
MDAIATTEARRALLAESELIEAFIIDVNGVPRGKWLQRDKADALLGTGIAIPRSAYLLDIWGRDIVEGGIAFDTGDPDGLCIAVPHSIAKMHWAEGEAVQALLTMREADGSLFYADPRGVLARVLERFAARGLTPALGVELEFYLVDPNRAGGQRIAPRGADESFWRGWQTDTMGLWEIHDYEAILRDLLRAAEAQSIALDTLISENGPGQFEVTLRYAPDALRIADDAVLFKRAVKQIARKHGLCATFMAKPFGNWAGSGMHVHMSVLGRDGANIFTGDAARPSAALYHALGGLVAAMPETMLIFAPHANSFRRFAPGTHAPVFGDWGHDNRMSAIRVINAEPRAARLEHRVAGADCNPYLAFAALLGAILDGIETEADPGPETLGDKTGAAAPKLPIAWSTAADRFANSARASTIFGEKFQSIFASCKRQEIAEFRRRISDVEYDAYLKNA